MPKFKVLDSLDYITPLEDINLMEMEKFLRPIMTDIQSSNILIRSQEVMGGMSRQLSTQVLGEKRTRNSTLTGTPDEVILISSPTDPIEISNDRNQ